MHGVMPSRIAPSTQSPRVTRRALAVAVVALGLSASSCASDGSYVWFTNLPRAEWETAPDRYKINVGDTVDISVYGNDGIHASGKVRRDGRIAVPLVGEVEVKGKYPADVARDLEVELKPFVVSPRVTVNIDQAQAVLISTLGEITHVGSFALEPPAVLIEALSQAGGLTDYADKSRIFVMRSGSPPQRIRFTYEAIIHNEGGAAAFPLRTGDVLIVE